MAAPPPQGGYYPPSQPSFSYPAPAPYGQPPSGYSAPPPPAGYAAPSPSMGYAAAPPSAGYASPPPPSGYGAPQPSAAYPAYGPPSMGHMPVEMTVVVCYSCGFQNAVPKTVLTLACGQCGTPNERPQLTVAATAPPQPHFQAPPSPSPSPPEEKPADPLCTYNPKGDVSLSISDMGAPIFFASLRDWRWKVRDAKGEVFEVGLQYSYKGKQENLTLTRGGIEIAFAEHAIDKYKIRSRKEQIGILTISSSDFLGGGEGEFALRQPVGIHKSAFSIKLARMGTHKMFERETMIARWKIESGTLMLDITEGCDSALILLIVCCILRWWG